MSRNDTVCGAVCVLLQHSHRQVKRDFMVLPHVAASRIVRQVSGLAHLSPGEWLQCLLARYVVQIFIQSTQKKRRSFL